MLRVMLRGVWVEVEREEVVLLVLEGELLGLVGEGGARSCDVDVARVLRFVGDSVGAGGSKSRGWLRVATMVGGCARGSE